MKRAREIAAQLGNDGTLYSSDYRKQKPGIGKAFTAKHAETIIKHNDKHSLKFDDVAQKERLEYLISSGGETDGSEELDMVRKRAAKLLDKKKARAENEKKKQVFGTTEERFVQKIRA